MDQGRGSDVAVVGAGIIGLAISWQAARAGLRVTLIDAAPVTGASYAGAGMLCPVTEVHYGEADLLELNLASASAWPAFAADLEAAAGRTVGYRPEGTLAVAWDSDDMRALDALHGYQQELGLGAERLSSPECRKLEPLLNPAVRGAVFVEGDHQVDTRAVTAALLAANERAGVRLLREPVAGLHRAGDVTGGVRLATGTVIEAPAVVLAAGSRSGSVAASFGTSLPVRPVKGQILRLGGRPGGSVLSRTVRAVRRGRSVYAVPRSDGRVVVGATEEEKGYDTTVTAAVVRDLLDDAIELVPALSEYVLLEATARLRPGTPDNRPLLGFSEVPGLVVATGHHRNGILLAPITAAVIVDMLTTGQTPGIAAPFSPLRFQKDDSWIHRRCS